MRLIWKLSKEASRYRWLYIVAIVSTLVLTLINLIAPKVLSAMTAAIQSGTQDTLHRILWLTVLLTGLYLSRILFRYLSDYLAHFAAWNLVEQMRLRVYEKIQTLSMSFFHDQQTGDLMSRVVNDTATFELLYAHIIPECITNFTMLFGVLAVLLTINVKLALFTCIPIPFIVLFSWIFTKKVGPTFETVQEELGNLNAKLQDNFSGIKEIQSFGKETHERENVAKHASAFTKANLRELKLGAIFEPFVEFASSAGTIIVVGLGGVLAFRSQLSIPDIVAFLLYLALFYAPITNLARMLEDLQHALAGAKRVVSILDTPCEIADAPGAEDLGNVSGDIAFENISFEYEKNNPVLKDISFDCKSGQMVALVGPTGVGKTTLTQLLARFYEPTAGRIAIDGQDISKATLNSLRKCIAPVSQDTFLFNGTIAENIGYAAPEADLEAIMVAAKAAHIHDSILQMPDGYETQVGERGIKLSGGQKQRVAIARAILRKAPIVLLDEATASVDTETEREIQKAIGELSGQRTILAIAHRLSTIEKADLILVMQDGKIVQRGTHEQLMAQDGLYKSLHEA